MFGSNFLGMGAEEDARQAMLAAGIDPDTGMPLASPDAVAPPPPAPAPQQAPIARQGTTFDIPKPDYSRVDTLRKEMQNLRRMGWFPSASYQRGNLAQQQILAHEIDAEQRRAADEYEAQLKRQAYLEAKSTPWQPKVHTNPAGGFAIEKQPGVLEPWGDRPRPKPVDVAPGHKVFEGDKVYDNPITAKPEKPQLEGYHVQEGADGLYGIWWENGRMRSEKLSMKPKPKEPSKDPAEDVNKDDAKALRKALREVEADLATGFDAYGKPFTPAERAGLAARHALIKRKLRELESGRFSGMGGGTDQSASGASAESVGRTGAAAPQQKKLGDPLGIR